MHYLIRNLAKILFGIFLYSSLVLCSDRTQHSTDFTKEFSFTKGIEGPAVNEEGVLFAVNFQKEGTIGRVSQEGKGSIYAVLPKGSIGNGIRFDYLGNMYIADYAGHKVYRIKKNTREPIIWAQDSLMNQPNDLAISPSGIIYLSDPDWKNSTGNIWMVTADQKPVCLEQNMGTTNGIEVSPDGAKLYVNESVQRNIWQYDIQPDGALKNKTLFASFKDFGLDGMRCDIKGNLYITRYDKGTVVILSAEGEKIDEIMLTGKKPSNIAFGGKDGKSCYVTMADRGCIERFTALFPGNYYSKIHK